MILIVTHKTDFTADFVVNRLNERKVRYYRLNCDDIPHGTDISLSSESEFCPKIDGISSFSSVWFRRTKLPVLVDIDPYIEAYYLSELKWFQRNLWNTIQARWVSKPDSVNRAENKFLQLKVAQQIGFAIPPTLISANRDKILSFFNHCDEEVIIKPIFNSRFESASDSQLLYTSKISKKDLDLLEESVPLPSIYQKYIQKRLEIRVTVVGNKVFSASVDSQQGELTKVDWRRDKLPFSQYLLPLEIQEKCVAIVRELGLSFGAIDLIETPENEFIFLEINPNGQWAWIEMDTELPIADSLIDLLLNKGNERATM